MSDLGHMLDVINRIARWASAVHQGRTCAYPSHDLYENSCVGERRCAHLGIDGSANVWIRETVNSGLRVACNMFAWPCQKRSERQSRRKSHQVMIRSVANIAETIVGLSIATVKPKAAFGHMTRSSPIGRDSVENGWVVSHSSRLSSSVGFKKVQSC